MHRYNTIMYLLVYQLVLRERKGGGLMLFNSHFPLHVPLITEVPKQPGIC